MSDKQALKEIIADYQDCPVGEWFDCSTHKLELTRDKDDDDEETRKLRKKLREYEEWPFDAFFDGWF